MLSVIAIFVILTVAVAPAITSTIQSSRIGMAAQFVTEEIHAARAAAVARNKPMELCFLRGTAGVGGFFEQLAIRSLEQDGGKKWINKNRKLPEGVVISGDSALSPVVGAQTEHSNSRGEKEVCLLFTPSGEMSLTTVSGDPPQEYYITLGALADLQKAPGVFPTNFATIRVDPQNSQTTLHRP